MANASILSAFERMWQHVVAALGNKANSEHTHDNYMPLNPESINMTGTKIYVDSDTYSTDLGLSFGSKGGFQLGYVGYDYENHADHSSLLFNSNGDLYVMTNGNDNLNPVYTTLTQERGYYTGTNENRNIFISGMSPTIGSAVLVSSGALSGIGIINENGGFWVDSNGVTYYNSGDIKFNGNSIVISTSNPWQFNSLNDPYNYTLLFG